ncbi:MAG: hypothetical protein R3B83_06025 [Nitrospirales bacterium]|nr:hypothetical protein [Nitrospirales bacterium]
MTIEVEVNGQLYTGASVVKVTVLKESEPLTKQLGCIRYNLKRRGGRVRGTARPPVLRLPYCVAPG